MSGRAPSDPRQPPPERSASPRRLGPVGATGRGPEGEGPSDAHWGKPERAGAKPRRGRGLGGPASGWRAACCEGVGRGEAPSGGDPAPDAVARQAACHPDDGPPNFNIKGVVGRGAGRGGAAFAPPRRGRGLKEGTRVEAGEQTPCHRGQRRGRRHPPIVAGRTGPAAGLQCAFHIFCSDRSMSGELHSWVGWPQSAWGKPMSGVGRVRPRTLTRTRPTMISTLARDPSYCS